MISLRFKRLAKKLLLLATAVIFSLILLEVLFRIFVPFPYYSFPIGLLEVNEDLCYNMKPGFSGIVTQPEFQIHYNTNSQGLRDYDYGQKEKDTVRILALGDSMQVGQGVEFNETYIKLLEARLNKDNTKKYELINAAVPGYGTWNEFIYLKNKIQEIQPDIVFVSFFVGNDLRNNLDECIDTIIDGVAVKKTNKLYQNNMLFKLQWFLEKNSRSYVFLTKQLGKNRLKPFIVKLGFKSKGNLLYLIQDILILNKNPDKEIIEGWSKTRFIFDNMLSIVEKNNARLVVFMVPHSKQLSASDLKDALDILGFDSEDFDPFIPGEKLSEILNENISFIDLLPALTERNNEVNLYYPIDGHLNKNGHRAISELLYEEFQKKGLLAG